MPSTQRLLPRLARVHPNNPTEIRNNASVVSTSPMYARSTHAHHQTHAPMGRLRRRDNNHRSTEARIDGMHIGIALQSRNLRTDYFGVQITTLTTMTTITTMTTMTTMVIVFRASAPSICVPHQHSLTFPNYLLDQTYSRVTHSSNTTDASLFKPFCTSWLPSRGNEIQLPQ